MIPYTFKHIVGYNDPVGFSVSYVKNTTPLWRPFHHFPLIRTSCSSLEDHRLYWIDMVDGAAPRIPSRATSCFNLFTRGNLLLFEIPTHPILHNRYSSCIVRKKILRQKKTEMLLLFPKSFTSQLQSVFTKSILSIAIKHNPIPWIWLTIHHNRASLLIRKAVYPTGCYSTGKSRHHCNFATVQYVHPATPLSHSLTSSKSVLVSGSVHPSTPTSQTTCKIILIIIP